jgi:hypothetical protein
MWSSLDPLKWKEKMDDDILMLLKEKDSREYIYDNILSLIDTNRY